MGVVIHPVSGYVRSHQLVSPASNRLDLQDIVRREWRRASSAKVNTLDTTESRSACAHRVLVLDTME